MSNTAAVKVGGPFYELTAIVDLEVPHLLVNLLHGKGHPAEHGTPVSRVTGSHHVAKHWERPMKLRYYNVTSNFQHSCAQYLYNELCWLENEFGHEEMDRNRCRTRPNCLCRRSCPSITDLLHQTFHRLISILLGTIVRPPHLVLPPSRNVQQATTHRCI